MLRVTRALPYYPINHRVFDDVCGLTFHFDPDFGRSELVRGARVRSRVSGRGGGDHEFGVRQPRQLLRLEADARLGGGGDGEDGAQIGVCLVVPGQPGRRKEQVGDGARKGQGLARPEDDQRRTVDLRPDQA